MVKRALAAAVIALQVFGFSTASAAVRLPRVIASHMVVQRDVPLTIWGWADPGEVVTVTLDGSNKATATADEKGTWRVALKPVKADGKAHALEVTGNAGEGSKIELEDILVGEVWVGSGQSNMEMALCSTQNGATEVPAATHPQIRLFNVPKIQNGAPAEDVNAAWCVCTPETANIFSGVLYHFGLRLNKDLDVPVGLINASWSGSPIQPWIINDGGSGGMYNGMIAPLTSFAVRGVIWYQGETNVIQGMGLGYYEQMKMLIEGWRKVWGTDFPFYFVQIAPWAGGEYAPGQLPALWEAQAASLKIPRTGMAVTTDLVHNINDIHPINKLDVGNRLALWALAKTYGNKGIVYSGPLYKSMQVEGSKIRLSFAHTGSGLQSRDGQPLNEFQIAGEDNVFVAANAVVEGETVVVEAEGVAAPTQVRFGWRKVANPNLVNKEGLPASPFQTNNWQGGTGE